MQSGEKKLLSIAQFHLGRDKAERYVKHLARKLGIPVPQGKDYNKDLLIHFLGKNLQVNFSELIMETQVDGVPSRLQLIADARDKYLAPAMTIAMGTLPGGLKIEMTSSLGMSSHSVKAPGLIESPEMSLANDILYFRRLACENSSVDSLETCARYFRSYLLSCVSLVDCFLSRYTNTAKELVGDVSKYENVATLASTSEIEKRIDAWFRTFAFHEIDNYKRSTDWLHFQRIRGMRNMFVHPPEPIATYSIKEMAKYLNYCAEGVGGLLGRFHSYAGQDPHVGFIQKVRTAPKVAMCAK